MKFLKLKHSQSKSKKRKNGTYKIVPLIVEKSDKRSKQQSTQNLSVKNPIIFCGANSSGKSRNLERLYEHALDIWGGRKVSGKVWISKYAPLSASCDENEQMREWYERYRTQKKAKHGGLTWSRLTAWQKQRLLVQFCKDCKAVVFVDDCDKITGQKLDVAIRCVRASRIFVFSSSDISRLPHALRQSLTAREYQDIDLSTDVSYDVSKDLVWGAMGFAMMLGLHELAITLGVLKGMSGMKRWK